MKSSVKHLFDIVAQDYDMQRKQLIPCFDDFYGMALDLMESSKDTPHILDLGAGTGLLSGMLLQKYPNARLTLMDISEKMLRMARPRFAGTDQVQYVVGDYTKHAFTSSYDMIISSLSIHHLTHVDKKNVFGTVYKMLEPGGLFINADQVQGRTPETDAYYRNAGWMPFIRADCQMKPSRLQSNVVKLISMPSWMISCCGWRKLVLAWWIVCISIWISRYFTHKNRIKSDRGYIPEPVFISSFVEKCRSKVLDIKVG